MTTTTPTLADQAYDAVETLVVTLALAPGTVFSEATLSESIGIGRTPLREALQRLAAEGLIVAMPRRGMRVTEIDLAGFRGLLDTRRVLDGLIAERAARRATPEQRSALEGATTDLLEAASAGDLEAYLRADRAGDEVLAEAARNPFAARAVAPLHVHCRRFWTAYQHEGDITRSAALHGDLAAAVLEADEAAAANAAAALVDDLDRIARHLLDLP